MADYTMIQSGDPDAAENVGGLAGDIDRGGITSGLALSNYDSAAPSIDVTAGKTVHILDTATAEWTLELSSLPDGVVVIDRTNGVRMSNGGISVPALEATDVLTAPKYATRSDVPDIEGIYRVDDVDGNGNFGIIAREK